MEYSAGPDLTDNGSGSGMGRTAAKRDVMKTWTFKYLMAGCLLMTGIRAPSREA